MVGKIPDFFAPSPMHGASARWAQLICLTFCASVCLSVSSRGGGVMGPEVLRVKLVILRPF